MILLRVMKHEKGIECRERHCKHVAVLTTDVVVNPAVDSLNALVLVRVIRCHVAEYRIIVVISKEVIERIPQLGPQVVHVVNNAVLLGPSICSGIRRVSLSLRIDGELPITRVVHGLSIQRAELVRIQRIIDGRGSIWQLQVNGWLSEKRRDVGLAVWGKNRPVPERKPERVGSLDETLLLWTSPFVCNFQNDPLEYLLFFCEYGFTLGIIPLTSQRAMYGLCHDKNKFDECRQYPDWSDPSDSTPSQTA